MIVPRIPLVAWYNREPRYPAARRQVVAFDDSWNALVIGDSGGRLVRASEYGDLSHIEETTGTVLPAMAGWVAAYGWRCGDDVYVEILPIIAWASKHDDEYALYPICKNIDGQPNQIGIRDHRHGEENPLIAVFGPDERVPDLEQLLEMYHRNADVQCILSALTQPSV